MNVLDLFSGLGGWGRAFQERGHNVTTLDINPEFEPDICENIVDWEAEGYYDVVLASPPCTEFSKASLPKSWACNRKFGCNPDTSLVLRTLAIIELLKPKWWVIENVRGAVPYFKPILGKPIKKVGSRYLWGKFPMFDAAPKYGKWKLPKTKNRPALRSLIPYNLSLAVCLACERELLLVQTEGDKHVQ